MKDSEFIEILNLYLDHEMSAGDSARLEAEVINNPERRQLYRQYCRMHKACVALGAQAPADAPAWEQEKIRTFAPQRGRWNAGAYAGGLLAAACLAMIVVVRLRTVPVASAAHAPAAAASVAAAQPAAVRLPAEIELQPVFATRTLASLVDTSRSAPVTSPELNDQFAWMNRIQLAPIQGAPIESAMFAPAPVLLDSDNRAISAAQPPQTERAAFQFQR